MSNSARLRDLGAAGQAVWLDFVERTFLAQGGLRKLIENDGLTGVTSNPSIFEKAMGSGTAYDAGLRALLRGAAPGRPGDLRKPGDRGHQGGRRGSASGL